MSREAGESETLETPSLCLGTRVPLPRPVQRKGGVVRAWEGRVRGWRTQGLR